MADKLLLLLKDARDQLMDNESLIEQYVRQEGRAVDEVLIEKEARQTIIELLPLIYEILSWEDKKILERYIVDGYTEAAIGVELKMSQQAVSDRMRKIPSKILKNLAKIACKSGKCSLVSRTDFTLEIGVPVKVHEVSPPGYPFELLQNVNLGGYWNYKTKDKKKVFYSRSKCKMPEYLARSFAKKPVCTICKRCRRENANR